MKSLFLAFGFLAAFTLTTPNAAAAEKQKIAYPSADDASFIITVPKNWELTPAKEDEDYFHVEGPTGAIFSFRAIPGGKDSLDEAIEAMVKDIHERFKDMELGDAQDWKPNGLTGFYAIGTGKDKEGVPIRIGVAWCALNDGKIAEAWFITDLSDEKGLDQANEIINSIESP